MRVVIHLTLYIIKMDELERFELELVRIIVSWSPIHVTNYFVILQQSEEKTLARQLVRSWAPD